MTEDTPTDEDGVIAEYSNRYGTYEIRRSAPKKGDKCPDCDGLIMETPSGNRLCDSCNATWTETDRGWKHQSRGE